MRRRSALEALQRKSGSRQANEVNSKQLDGERDVGREFPAGKDIIGETGLYICSLTLPVRFDSISVHMQKIRSQGLKAPVLLLKAPVTVAKYCGLLPLTSK